MVVAPSALHRLRLQEVVVEVVAEVQGDWLQWQAKYWLRRVLQSSKQQWLLEGI